MLGPEFFALSIIILLFSVILHEVMHGLVALYFGDHTAERAGRLTLNPLPHIDPIGTILMPAIFIILPLLTGIRPGIFLAWAKPVPVNPLNFSDIKRGELLVSLAGVGANFGLSLIGAVLYHLTGPASLIGNIAQFMVGINLLLGIFNLLPIPPLDGSNALMALMPYNATRTYEQLSRYGILILLLLLYSGFLGLIVNLIILPLHHLLGVPPL